VLGAGKNAWLSRIEALPRRSQERRAAFYDMHHQIAQAAATNPELQRWQRQYEQAEHIAHEEQTLFNRELYYAIQPKNRLEGLIDRCCEQVPKAV
jgi:hypothetical protein